ncbi:MAG: S-methyl-5'-thioadenosine phosphorylase [Desulfomonilaceae bacterium]
MTKIAVIGGSGFDDPDFLQDTKSVKIGAPFGHLSADPLIGKLGSTEIVVLNRHGKGHRIAPAQVNYRANIWAMKELGVTHIIATTACGSLREEIEPGDLVFPDQLIDWTKNRKSTFHEGDQVAHISMADPFCNRLRSTLIQAAKEEGIKFHSRGVVITIEGPRFSTRAESNMFRLWGADIINMSTSPEAALAREAGICYAIVAMSTDYDCWRHSDEPVTWDMIVATMKKNVSNVKKIFISSIPSINFESCACRNALDCALV